jgi:hypothetical protein
MAGKRLAPRFSEEEIDLGLATVALFSGNTRRASAALKEHGLKVSQATLYKWKAHRYVERYDEIYKRGLPLRDARTAQRFEEITEAAADATQRLIDRTDQALHENEIPARDLPGAARNMATAAAISVDKALLMRGRPTQIVERQDAAPLLRKLEALGVATLERSFDAETTAEEENPSSGT